MEGVVKGGNKMAKLNDEVTLFNYGYVDTDIAECKSLDGKGKPNSLASKVKRILNFTTISAKVHKIPTEPSLAEFVDMSMSDQELNGFDPFEAIPPRNENYAFHVEVTPSPPRRKKLVAGQEGNNVKYISIRELERPHHISEPLAFNPFDLTQASIEFELSSAVMPSHVPNSRLQQDINGTTSTCSGSNTAPISSQTIDPPLLHDTTEESTVFWAYSDEETPLILDVSSEPSPNTILRSRRGCETTPNISYLESDPPLELYDSPSEHSTSNISSISHPRLLQLYNTPSNLMPCLQDLISQNDAASVNTSINNISDKCCEAAEVQISSCPNMLEGISTEEQLLDVSSEQSPNTIFPSRRDFCTTPDTSYLELDPPLGIFDSPVEHGANNVTSTSYIKPLQLYNTPSSPTPYPQTNRDVFSQIDAASVNISINIMSDKCCEAAEVKNSSCPNMLEGISTQEQPLDVSSEQSPNTIFPSRRDFCTTPDTSYLELDPPLGIFDSPVEHGANNITSTSDIRPLQLYNTPSSPTPFLPTNRNVFSQIDAASGDISVKNTSNESGEVAGMKTSGCTASLEGVDAQEQLRAPDSNARRMFLLLCVAEGDEGFEVTPVAERTCSFPLAVMRKNNVVSDFSGDDTPKTSNCTAI